MNEGNENWKGKQIGEVYTLDKNTPHLFFQLFLTCFKGSSQNKAYASHTLLVGT